MEKSREVKKIEEQFNSALVQKKMAQLYLDSGDEEQYLIYMQFSKEDYQAILEIEPNNIETLNNISFNDFEIARNCFMPRDKIRAIELFKEVLKNYFHILKLKHSTNTLFDISALYSRMAEVYDGLGEYHKAIESFKNAIEYCQKFLEEEMDLEVLVNMSVFQSDMAKIYTLIGKNREAIEYYKKSIKNSRQAIEEESNIIALNNLAISYGEKAEIYSTQGVMNKDITLIQKAMKLLKNSSDYYDMAYKIEPSDVITLINRAFNSSQIASIFVYIHKDKEAIIFFEEALETLNKAEEIEKSEEVINAKVQTLSKLAQLYNRQYQYNRALELLQEASIKMVHNKSDLNRLNNNATILSEMGLVYFELSKPQESIDSFKESLQYFKLAQQLNPNSIMVLENISRVFSYLMQLELKESYFEEAIAINYRVIELYEIDFLNIFYEDDALGVTQNMIIPLLQLIKTYQHSNRAYDKKLLQAIERIKAKKLKELMFTNFIEESEELNSIRTELQQLKKKFRLSNYIDDVEKQQKLYDSYQYYIHQLSTLLPLSQEEINIEKALKSLDKSEAIIYPIYDGKQLITIVVTKEKIDIYEEKMKHDIEFIRYIAKGEKKLLEALEYIEKPLLKAIPKNINKIYFSPFRELNLLPLHALVADRSNGFESYIIEEYEISYIPSLTILHHLKERSTLNVKPTDNLFVSIEEFKQEAELSKAIIKGKSFVDMELEQLKALLYQQNHNIIHLSTHGGVDIDNPLNSKIMIQEPNRYISLLEIYGLSFRANLVTISACQTNISKVESADEVLAFERAFLVAGADSTLTTFDIVNSYSTRKFMERFYGVMDDSNSISSAFQSASIKSIDVENMEWKLFRFMGV